MKSFSTFKAIFPSFLILILFSFIALWLFFSNEIKAFYYDEKINELLVHAELISNSLDSNEIDNKDYINKFCKTINSKSNTRITIIQIDGKVIGDSHEDPQRMDNHINRPEVIKAISGNMGTTKRYSNTLQKEMLYLARFYDIGDQQIIIRTAMPDESLGATLDLLQNRLIIGGLIILFVGALLSYIISKTIANPIINLTKQVNKVSTGNLKEKIRPKGTKEIYSLTVSFNEMASQLAERIESITVQSNEQKAILSSLIEGIIAIDNAGSIIRINPAAIKILGIDNEKIIGSNINTSIQNPDISEYFNKYIYNDQLDVREIIIPSNNYQAIRIYGVELLSFDNKKIGALFVLTDISQIKKLERIRQDFVANVSHELKTPITTIKGFVETLKNVKIKDKKTIRKYLNFIGKSTDRMNAIISDLLELSRLEQQEHDTNFTLKKYELNLVSEAAIQECEYQAEKKAISIKLECDKVIKAPLDIGLMTQAVKNLIDNAIQYSNENKSIIVKVKKLDEFAVISVTDEGPGIEKKYLTRLFERFYRIDKSRSRKHGGTGLGLSIVKHIAHIHNGRVSVESKIGHGSTFSIIIPTK